MKRRTSKKLQLKRRLKNKGYLKLRKIIFIGIICFLLVVLFVFIFPGKRSTEIDTSTLSKESTITNTKNTSNVSLQSNGSYLYKTQSTGLDAAYEFIRTAPKFEGEAAIPKNFAENSTLSRSIDDSSDPFLQKNNININNQHFLFDQTINNIPVYNSALAIHIRNGNEIYSVDGNLLIDQNVEGQILTEEDAKNIAINKALTESVIKFQPAILKEQKYILNKKLVEETNDEKNYLTLAVTVGSDDGTEPFEKEYFVDLVSGNIVYEKNLIKNAKNLSAQDKRNNQTRTTGQPPVGGDGNLDKIYDWLSRFYDYFFNTFQRDGQDGKGGQMVATLSGPCGNASTNSTGKVSFCDDLVGQDVAMHELGHGIIFFTSDFNDDALHEGFADIIGEMFDTNWLGQYPDGKVSRNLMSPASIKQPEKSFSANWSCGQGEEHSNGVLAGHTTYLMARGGSENGCTITGIGDENTFKIVYQGLTKYFNSASNFLDIYNGFNNACNDLFQAGSATCISVNAAMMATELDQWKAGAKDSPKCSGGTEKTPVCPAAVSGAPTSGSPTGQQTGVSPTIPSGGGVPSAVCMGNCPTLAVASPTVNISVSPTQPAVQSTQQPIPTQLFNNPQPTVSPTQITNQNNPGNTNPKTGGLIELIMKLINLILQFLMSLFGLG